MSFDFSKKIVRSFTLSNDGIDVENRTVKLAFSSEDMALQWFGYEILDHKPESIRLGRLNDGGALLMDHNPCDQVGVVDSAYLRADKMTEALVRFGRSARASEVLQDVVDGIRRKVSVGYNIHAAVQEGMKDGTPIYRVTDWEPFEVSIVAIPADNTVGVGRNLITENNNQNEIISGDKPMEQQPVQINDAVREQQIQEVRNEARLQEMARVRDIRSVASNFTQFGSTELADEYIGNGKSLNEFNAAVLERAGKKAVPSGALGMDEKDVKRFSFSRLIHAKANPDSREAQKAAAYEFEVCSTAAEKRGKDVKGVYIPIDVLQHRDVIAPVRRDLLVGTASAGGYSVATELLASSWIDLLRNAMVTQKLGARVLNDLVGNIAIPRLSAGATAYWVAENSAPTESQQTLEQVTMGPKTIAAYTDFSRKLLIQSSIDVENMVKSDLAKVIGLGIDYAAFYGSGSSNQPTGIKNVSGINTKDFAADAPTWAEIVNLETQVAAANADLGNLAYAISATGRGSLKTTAKASNTPVFIMEDNLVNGYRVEVSNQIATNDYWFGNWDDLLIGMWSGLDLLVDPYTGSNAATVRVTAFQDTDIAVRHPVSFTRGNNTL